MKRNVLYLLIAAFIGIAIFSTESEAVSAETFDIGSYNIGSGASAFNGKMTTQRSASLKSLIQAQNFDFIGLQEVDCKTTRNDGRNIQKEVCPSNLPLQIYGQGCLYKGGAYNNGLLAKNTVRGERVRYLTSSINGVEYEQRSYQRVVLEKNGYYVAIYNTHLSHENTALRASQIQALKSAVNSDSIPNRVIMGDFNATASELKPFFDSGYKAAKDKNGEYIKTLFNSSGTVTASIDHILVSSNIGLEAATSLGSFSQSDHKMLKTRITVSDKGSDNLRTESDGTLLFTLKPGTKEIIDAQQYIDNRLTYVWEYYPGTIYGNHGKNIIYKFFVGSYGNITSAQKRQQGDGKIIYKYQYANWAKYGIHSKFITKRTKV